MPNLIITGPPGIGKTTSIMCLAHEMLGDQYKEAVLELNASDDRNRIKMFAQKKVTLAPGQHKIIILDEADSMTSGAQQALRRTMEIYSSTTRFCLACNLSSKIIEPIQSRCAILRYTRLSDTELLKRLVNYTPEGLEAIVFTAEGDMRQAVNNLQSTHAGFGTVTPLNVFKVCDQPHPAQIQQMIQFCVQGDPTSALTILETVYSSGFSAVDIVSTIFKVTKTFEMPEIKKMDFIKEIGLSHMTMLEGCTSLLQLSGLTVRLCRIGSTQ
ncbi:replication factor C subunit 4 [Gorgonomyces haynaldii]|nr:replication factor C subunit 4 [Gorgonomyces haynaldii]